MNHKTRANQAKRNSSIRQLLKTAAKKTFDLLAEMGQYQLGTHMFMGHADTTDYYNMPDPRYRADR